MKIRKVGRERPVLYRGKFDVPIHVIKRLTVSKNHFILANIANFNGKVDEYYLAIDNVLSAIIVAKEGNLTTFDHQKKITKFFKHLKRRARIRSIDESDFSEFYKLWSKSRYSLYFPSVLEIKKLRLFTLHLLEFATTEIARLFRSDETILAQKIDELLEIHQSEALLEETEHIHEYSQMEAERMGEIYGGKLGMKLANPWNFMEVSLLVDRKEIADIIDESEEVRELLVEALKIWDRLFSTVQYSNFKRIALEIANAKKKKRAIEQDVAIEEGIEAAAKHPEAQKFRLVLNFSYDSSEPKRIASFFLLMKKAVEDLIKNPNKAIKTGWENYKEYS